MNDELSAALVSGDRRALARAITLIESTRPEDRARANELIDGILAATGRSIRLAVSGTPGVGKSTFIESFGLLACDRGHRVAVLTIDPTSARTGGSILGDKTRMPLLSRDDRAYIRPSPAGGHLGGVARRTREAILLCEAAGFDFVIVETVGVGQSETAASELTDVFLLLIGPGGGDDLQGIKRGIMELADLVAVNKCDGDLVPLAERTVSDHRAALHLLRPKWPDLPTDVVAVSALTGVGLDALFDHVLERNSELELAGWRERQRRDQAVAALRADLHSVLIERILDRRDLADQLRELEEAVATGKRSAGSAATELLDHI